MTKEQMVFLEPPENFQPKIEVSGCFVAWDTKFLFLKQHALDSEANRWGMPGGRIEKAENAAQCSVREVLEETGLDITKLPLRTLGKVYIRYPEMDFIYWMFEAKLEQDPGPIRIDPQEHTEYRWMTLEEALPLPLIRGEVECILLYLNGSPL